MANLVINKVHFKIINPVISIWIKKENFFGAKKKKSSLFESVVESDLVQQNEVLYYSFEPVQTASEYSINLTNKKYFIKPYVTSKLRNYFEQKELMTIDDFVNGIQIWTPKNIKQQFKEYEKINLRQLSVSNVSKMELLISFDGTSYTTIQPLSKSNITSKYSKYLAQGKINRVKPDQSIDRDITYPVLSYPLKKELGFRFENFSKKNTYLEYYQKISAFYTVHLQGKIIGDNIQIYDDGFIKLTETEIHKTKFVSNKLRFANDGEDSSVYNGLKRYGPYAVPDTENLRFIFVYKLTHSEGAKKLHTALSSGLKEGAFSPGLKDYLKINFKMADPHRIVLETNDPISELAAKMQTYPFQ